MPTGLAHTYTPRGAAVDIFNDRSPEVLICGPAGTGKSLACLEKLNLLMLVNPGARGLIVRKTQQSLGASALDTWRKTVIVEGVAAQLVSFYGGSPQHPAQYRYTNGSTVTIGGMDKSSKVMSTEYDVIYVQEATELTETDWESLTTRLRNWVVSFQQLIADCNPDRPTHWLKVRCDSGRTKMLHSSHRDNPRLFGDDGDRTALGAQYLAKLEALTGMRRVRLFDGKWAASEGVIYENWDDSVHLVDRFEVPRSWPRYWSIDFGFTHPFVWQAWAEDPDGRLFLYREIFQTGRLVEDLAREVKAATADEPRPYKVVADHDAEGRATFEKYASQPTTPARKAVTEGIQAVQKRLQLAGDGKPRLFIMRDSVARRDPVLLEAKAPTCTYEEVAGYVWLPSPDGKPSKERPLKELDDGMDAMRYVVAELDLKQQVRARWI